MSLFSDSLLKQVRAYSIGHSESSKDLYAQRNQNINNLSEKIYKAKLCEFYVYFHLLNCGKKAHAPDLKIYTSDKKSYEADIFCYSHNVHVHVKSIEKSSAERFGLSWICEASDPIVNYPQLNHWFALTEYTDESNIRLVGWLNSHMAIYKPTKLNHPTKKAIYFDDIKHLL